MTVHILGIEYSIVQKKYDEDEAFERRSICGYCDFMEKQIVYCDMATYRGNEHETTTYCERLQKQTVRHEIVHAFLYESGLNSNSVEIQGSWADNEEMVDWFAIQGPKVYQAWKESGAI